MCFHAMDFPDCGKSSSQSNIVIEECTTRQWAEIENEIYYDKT